MKSLLRTTWVVCLLGVLVSVMPARAQYNGDFYEDYIADRLEVGFRISHYTLTDSKRMHYDSNGDLDGGYTRGISTYNMDAEPSYYPLPYIAYKFTPYVAGRLTWEQVRGRTITLDEADPHSDGDVIGSGPGLDVIGRWPNESMFTPYAGLGIIFWGMDFKEDSSFYDNGRRDINVENTTGYTFSLGCTANVYENWSTDLEMTYMTADTDAEFRFMGGAPTTWTFPMDTLYLRLGVKYEF